MENQSAQNLMSTSLCQNAASRRGLPTAELPVSLQIAIKQKKKYFCMITDRNSAKNTLCVFTSQVLTHKPSDNLQQQRFGNIQWTKCNLEMQVQIDIIQDKSVPKQMLNSNLIFLSPPTSFPAYLIKVPFPQTSVMKEKSIFRATSWKIKFQLLNSILVCTT